MVINTQHQTLPENQPYTTEPITPYTPQPHPSSILLSSQQQQPLTTTETTYTPPIYNTQENFITNEDSQKIINYLRTNCIFSVEAGHSVLAFGEPYLYPGYRGPSDTPPLP